VRSRCERGFQRRSVRSPQDYSSSHNNQSCSVKRRSGGSDSCVDGLERSALEVVRFWEFNLCHGKLTDLGATKLGIGDDAGSDDLDGVVGGGMATGHLHVHLGDSSAEGRVSVLLVHVHGTGTSEVTENDAVVSDAADLLLEDLGSGDDLTLDLADLVLTLHVIPELGPGENGVTMEDTHSVELRVRGLIRGETSTDNVKLFQLQRKEPHMS
jgi:hypothetical protein